MVLDMILLSSAFLLLTWVFYALFNFIQTFPSTLAVVIGFPEILSSLPTWFEKITNSPVCISTRGSTVLAFETIAASFVLLQTLVSLLSC